MSELTITRAIYDAFQRADFAGWDGIIAPDILINSPAGYGMSGLSVLKDWGRSFTNLGWRIDLVDEHLSLDADGNGRGFVTFVLHWKHTKDFLGMPPTGREGTSVETMLLTIEAAVVVRIDVASNTTDLVIYEYERGWPMPHNIRPPAILEGVDRRSALGPDHRVPPMTLTRGFYDAFQRAELDGWDAIISDDVLVNSPAGFGIRGLRTFKDFAPQFTDLAYRIDLVDEHLALDGHGNGRGFITFVLHWRHTKDFGGLAPTGREGTSVETTLLTIEGNTVTRIDVADNTIDLALYLWQRGWPNPHNQRPEPIVEGVDRRSALGVAA
jgi:hypothetical protein